MKFSLGILVVVALLGANARIWNEDNFAGPPHAVEGGPPHDDVEASHASISNYEDKSLDEYDEDQNQEMTELEMSELKDLEENGSEDELVDMENFDMSIFPKVDDVDPSLFIDEKDTNLTHGRCAITYQMPCSGRSAAHHTCWARTHSHCRYIYAATCHSCKGDVPGFYWGGRCYFTYGRRLYHTHKWSWIGVISGHSYYSGSNYCNIFGGYQRCSKRPLFFCVASYRGWLIPGKYDQNCKTCWYLNRHTHCFRKLAAH